MSQEIRNLEPKVLWNKFWFECQPRPSKKEERVIAFMMEFGQKLGLPTVKDHVGNVIIKTSDSRYGKPQNHCNAIAFGYGS